MAPLCNKYPQQKIELYVLTQKSICDKFLRERSKIKSNMNSTIPFLCVCVYIMGYYIIFFIREIEPERVWYTRHSGRQDEVLTENKIKSFTMESKTFSTSFILSSTNAVCQVYICQMEDQRPAPEKRSMDIDIWGVF